MSNQDEETAIVEALKNDKTVTTHVVSPQYGMSAEWEAYFNHGYHPTHDMRWVLKRVVGGASRSYFAYGDLDALVDKMKELANLPEWAIEEEEE